MGTHAYLQGKQCRLQEQGSGSEMNVDSGDGSDMEWTNSSGIRVTGPVHVIFISIF